MTETTTETSATPTPKSGVGAKIAIAVAVAIAAVVAFVGYFFLSSDAEDAVSIDSTRDSIQVAEDAAGDETAEGDATTSLTTAEDFAGTWTIAQGNPDNIESGTFVGYRVNEVLQGFGEKEATGRSPAVDGEIDVDTDGAVTAGTITVDMTQLTSDSDRRDGALSRFGIEYDTFPTATFVFSEDVAVDLAALADGQTQMIDATGMLDLHGVAAQYTIPLTIERKGDAVIVVGSTEIVMSNHDITPPQVGPVLEIEDRGVLELQLALTKTS